MSTSYTADHLAHAHDFGRTLAIHAGFIGDLLGGVIIWIYEAVVWVGVQHLMPLGGIPRNATGLAFGKSL